MASANGHGPKRAILYARVSTDEQARSGYSLAQQMEALREYAVQEGYEVLEEVTDPGQSGASLERPGMDRVRDLVAAGGVSVVLAQDRDRFGREPAFTYLLRREFQEQGCTLKSLNDRGDESPEGELMDGVFDQFAKFERAKLSERSRRGKVRKAREGKVIIARRPRYGFKPNGRRDGYEIDEAQMQVVRRIFGMAVEGMSFKAMKHVFEREGIPTPQGAEFWDRAFFRRCIMDDVYRPHSFEEIAAAVSPEVAARLNPDQRYGLWWFNRRGVRAKQVSEPSNNGRRYRTKYKWHHKPVEEWIAVPVPDSGIARTVVDAARAAIKDQRTPSSAGRRFWELSGGILFCSDCGRRMTPTPKTKIDKGRRYVYSYYRCSRNHLHGQAGCVNSKNFRAEKLEQQIWEHVRELLLQPERLRAGLRRYAERERELAARRDPEQEAKAWLERIAAADRQRAKYQEMAAEELITFNELRERLEGLEEAKKTAHGELESISLHRQRLEELERSAEDLVRQYAAIVPESLDAISPEEKHQIYKTLKMRVLVNVEGTVTAETVLGEVTETDQNSVKMGDLCL
jgi:site-specific DNA recombinase